MRLTARARTDGECWAAPALPNSSGRLDSSKCTQKCRNDASETCGGSDALDVYFSKKRAALSGPVNKQLLSFKGWTYDNCACYPPCGR